jgi:heme/copper-type cytochrome/quinol oxidase subunit 3
MAIVSHQAYVITSIPHYLPTIAHIEALKGKKRNKSEFAYYWHLVDVIFFSLFPFIFFFAN